MRHVLHLALALLATSPARAQSDVTVIERAARWERQVETLSSDTMEGRAPGTPGHLRAVDRIVDELRRIGLEPAGTEGFTQPVQLTEQRMDLERSGMTIVSDGGSQSLSFPSVAMIDLGKPVPERIDAPLVFVGYGLHIPDAGHDDLAGIDLAGKIAVYVAGRPANIPATAMSSALAQRDEIIAGRGAVASIYLMPASMLTTSWTALISRASRSGVFLTDGAAPFLDMLWNPEENELLFAGAGTSFADVVAIAQTGQRIPRVELTARLTGTFEAIRTTFISPNVIARLPGSDPMLRDEYIAVSAHTDGYGIGEPVNGDRIYNGALDNAHGVAALLDMAEQLQAQRPRRSILFAFVTAEERGLLGSRYFVRNPTVPRERIVANLNYDMALPLFPLTSVLALGSDESSLGADAQAVGAAMNLPLSPDPYPERNSFTRSDQFAFIEAGIPALAFKFGFAAGTPEAELDRLFRAEHYHKPSDDMRVRIYPTDEIRLHDFIIAVALRVANADGRPRWNEGSRFDTQRVDAKSPACPALDVRRDGLGDSASFEGSRISLTRSGSASSK